MISAQPTSTRRLRTFAAAVVTLTLAGLAGPAGASADSISLTSVDPFPEVGHATDFRLRTLAYEDGYAHVYVENGRSSCPASVDAAIAAGMDQVTRVSVDGDGDYSSVHPAYSASAEGPYLFCGYLHRGSDTATARGTASMVVDIQEEADAPIVTVDASQPLTTSNTVTAEVSCPRACSLQVGGRAGSSTSGMHVTLGMARATIPTFGGSATVALSMTSLERRDLRQRIAAGERVRADLTATASYPIVGWSYTTTATTQLSLFSGPTPEVTFSGV